MSAACNKCKYWNIEEGRMRGAIGLCTKPIPLWDATEFDYDDPQYMRKPLEKFKNLKMFCQDMSDCHATLYTKPDFFCAHYEEIK
jgi:hypothetical protein